MQEDAVIDVFNNVLFAYLEKLELLLIIFGTLIVLVLVAILAAEILIKR